MAIERRTGRRGDTLRVTVYNPATKRKEHVGTFRRVKDAELAEARAKLRIAGGEKVSKPTDIGFRDLCEKWTATLTCKPTSIEEYKCTIKHLVAHFGNRPVSSITPHQIDSLVAALDRKYAPRTVRSDLSRLRTILRIGKRWGYRVPDVEPHNLPALPGERRMRILTPEQVAQLLDASGEWRTLILTAATTGLRRGELSGLQWQDLDLEAGTLTVRRQYQRGRYVTPKSNASYRTLHLPPSTIASLTAHRLTVSDAPTDPVFQTPLQRPVNETTMRQAFADASKGAGLSVTPHDLRHTFASVLIRRGASARLLQTLIGHASAAFTMNIYGHLFPDEAAEAALGVEDWLLPSE